MKTFWGEVSVCDAHVHFFSHHFFGSLAAQKQDPALGEGRAAVEAVTRILGWQCPPPDPRDLAEHWAIELDRHGVSRAAEGPRLQRVDVGASETTDGAGIGGCGVE